MSAADRDSARPWLICQLGAREHYVLASAFERMGRLRALVTDTWAPPDRALSRISRLVGLRIADRFASGLAGARVDHFTGQTLAREAIGRVRRQNPAGWRAIMQRNAWFERRCATRLRSERLLDAPVRPAVFAYSYAALRILESAREAGCPTVLGQIDAGIVDEDIVADAVARHPEYRSRWERAPAAYWQRWRQECALADRIVVNSRWARDRLVEAGIDAAKLRIVPLAFEGEARAVRRDYPVRFTRERPMRVLFLGSVAVRKGIAELLDAARLLKSDPIEFHLVGHESVSLDPWVDGNMRIIRHGAVPRSSVAAHYAAADVFVFPSLSDGFGLTQLEAQAFGLPVIASTRCGDVVRDSIDGILVDPLTAEGIASALRLYLQTPSLLAAHSRAAAGNLARFTPAAVAERLMDLMEDSP